MSTEAYNKLFDAIVNKEPVEFKKIFESIMKDKATEYVAALKEELHKTVFNIKEVATDATDSEEDSGEDFNEKNDTVNSQNKESDEAEG